MTFQLLNYTESDNTAAVRPFHFLIDQGKFLRSCVKATCAFTPQTTIGRGLRPTFPGSAAVWSVNSLDASPNKTSQTGKRARVQVRGYGTLSSLKPITYGLPVSGVKDVFFVRPTTDLEVLPMTFLYKDVTLPGLLPWQNIKTYLFILLYDHVPSALTNSV